MIKKINLMIIEGNYYFKFGVIVQVANADIVAETMQLESNCHIKLDGPEPLQLTVKSNDH